MCWERLEREQFEEAREQEARVLESEREEEVVETAPAEDEQLVPA